MLTSTPPRAAVPDLRSGAAARTPIPLLLLVADTGGGHRSAAQAVADALGRAYPGRFAPVLLDPLTGPRAPWPLRRVTGLYGPLIRRAPWLWGLAYRLTDSGRAVRVLARTGLRLAERPVAEAIAAHRPAALVSFHPLATSAAVASGQVPGLRPGLRPGQVPGLGPGGAHRVPVVTVVTDLVSAHSAWRYGPVDRIVVPSAPVALGCHRAGIGADRCLDLGLPVGPQFRGGPPAPAARAELRRSLGLGTRSFVVVVTGGGEGAGGLARRVSALLGTFAGAEAGAEAEGVEVVVLCGRNRRLQRRLERLEGGLRRRGPAGGVRLTVRGFVGNMAEWLRCADVVVTKAGPGTIAEAACCGAPLIITSRLPGQEDGNAEFVVGVGAGCHAPRPADVAREAGRLRRDPGALAAMRAASVRLGRPDAAASVAALLAGLAQPSPGLAQPSPGPARKEASGARA